MSDNPQPASSEQPVQERWKIRVCENCGDDRGDLDDAGNCLNCGVAPPSEIEVVRADPSPVEEGGKRCHGTKLIGTVPKFKSAHEWEPCPGCPDCSQDATEGEERGDQKKLESLVGKPVCVHATEGTVIWDDRRAVPYKVHGCLVGTLAPIEGPETILLGAFTFRTRVDRSAIIDIWPRGEAPDPCPHCASPHTDTEGEQGERWTIFVCSRCGSPEKIEASRDAVVCRSCSLHHLSSEAPTIEVVPSSALSQAQAELERVRIHMWSIEDAVIAPKIESYESRIAELESAESERDALREALKGFIEAAETDEAWGDDYEAVIEAAAEKARSTLTASSGEDG